MLEKKSSNSIFKLQKNNLQKMINHIYFEIFKITHFFFNFFLNGVN
jgi:hypothetical protein